MTHFRGKCGCIAYLDTVDDLETTVDIDFTNVTSMCPSFVINCFLRVLGV